MLLRLLVGVMLMATALCAATPQGPNLLANPGFEEEGGWQSFGSGFSFDNAEHHSGQRSLRLTGESFDGAQGAMQQLVFETPLKGPLLVSAWSKAEGAEVQQDYNLYLDVIYTDGSPDWGIRANFASGTHDWEEARLVFSPAKPIARIDVHVLFRRATGTVWVDDVTVEPLPFELGEVQFATDLVETGGRASVQLACTGPVDWQLELLQAGASLGLIKGSGKLLRGTWERLEEGPARLEVTATDPFSGQAERLSRDFEIAAQGSPLLLWTASSCTNVTDESPPGSDQALRPQAARGEWESGQVVVCSGLGQVEVWGQCSTLRGPDGALIGDAEVSLRRVALVAGHPDALLPMKPIRLQPWQQQAFWLSVHVPESTPAGLYEGRITLYSRREGGSLSGTTVPVTLEVWRGALPLTPSLPAVFGISDKMFSDRYGLTEGSPEWGAALARWWRFLMDYRMAPYFCRWQWDRQPQHYSYAAPYPIGDERADEFLSDPRLTAIAVPYPLDGDLAQLAPRLAYLKAKGWLGRAYLYPWDEPLELAQYEQIKGWAADVHSLAPEARLLVTYYAGPGQGPHQGQLDAVPDLFGGAVQVYAMGQGSTGDSDDYWQQISPKLKPGQEWWLYVCCGPGNPSPNLFITPDGFQNRAVLWRLWREQAQGFLYWAVNSYGADTAEGKLAFNPGLPDGDGVLVYPGEAFGEEGPVASVRLERWRDSAEDWEYLQLLEAQSGRQATLEALSRVYRSYNSYATEGQQVEDWRREMALRLGWTD